jgi:NTE family protein
MFDKDRDFSLVLSGGGALGIAHIGVIEDIQRLHLTPKEIVGTSMGAIIGACFAIGMSSSKIYTLFEKFANVLNWIKLSFDGNAVIKHKKIKEIFEEIFNDKKISSTTIPLKIVTTRLKTGEKRVFSSQDDIKIVDALLASMAIPGIFEEHIIDDEVYVDGFLCENLGVLECNYKQVLAVDVLGKNSFESNLPNKKLKTLNVANMFEKSMRLLIYNQTQTNISICDKEIYLIEPDTKKYKTFHFHKYNEIYPLGVGLLKIS